MKGLKGRKDASPENSHGPSTLGGEQENVRLRIIRGSQSESTLSTEEQEKPPLFSLQGAEKFFFHPLFFLFLAGASSPLTLLPSTLTSSYSLMLCDFSLFQPPTTLKLMDRNLPSTRRYAAIPLHRKGTNRVTFFMPCAPFPSFWGQLNFFSFLIECFKVKPYASLIVLPYPNPWIPLKSHPNRWTPFNHF